MERDAVDSHSPTRRAYLTYGAALAGSAALAGCTERVLSRSEGGTPTGRSGSGSYTVTMEPVGEVQFESVPETWVANNGSWADMGVALGLELPKALWMTSRYHTQYYDAVDGVSVDKSDITSLYQDGVSKELFYGLNGDVHVADPNFLTNRFKGWEQSDVKEIQKNVAPFFGNCIYAQHYPWHSDYRYYSLYEGFGKLAELFQRTDRYEAFVEVHKQFQGNLAPVIPQPGERPAVAVLWGTGDQPEQFYPYVIGGGTSFKHFRDLKVQDALADTDIKDFHASRAAIDLETVLEVDPPVLMLRGYESKSRAEFEGTVVSFLEDHETASRLTAVENGDVYRAGGLYMGPITNMVVTERVAKHLYGYDGKLFDRQRVADILAGDI